MRGRSSWGTLKTDGQERAGKDGVGPVVAAAQHGVIALAKRALGDGALYAREPGDWRGPAPPEPFP